MTTTDKTGEKLAASVRRTKENVAQEATPAAPVKKAPVKRTAAASGRSTAAAAKPTSSRTTTAKTTTASRQPAKTKAAATVPGDGDPYQGGRRIWPD